MFVLFLVYFSTYWCTALLTSAWYERDIPFECARRVIFNQLVYSIFPASLFLVWTPSPYEWRGVWLPLLQILGCILLTDILFYPLHRLLHTRFFFAAHKRHHWKETLGAGALYCSPLEYTLTIVPPLLSSYLVSCDELNLLVWTFLSTSNLVLAHAQEGRHKVHHVKFSKNFGAGFMLMDRLFGTLSI